MSQTTTKSHQPGSRLTSVQSTSSITNPNLSTLSNQELLSLCAHYGTQAKLWKQKFLGLLPEVDRRKLYLAQGCSSIFEFGAKVGGVSREQVLLILRLDKRFEPTPQLKQALTSGIVPITKLARIASVATPENEAFWLAQAAILPRPALEVLVKDSKSQGVPWHASKPNKTEKVAQADELHLSPRLRERLLALQNKGMNLEELMEEFLNQREERIQQEKQKIAEELSEKEGKQSQQASRSIPAKVKRVLKLEYGEKCAQEFCINKSTNTHHTRRFGLNPSHNPLFLAPLCNQHHEIAHAVDVKVQEHRGRGGPLE